MRVVALILAAWCIDASALPLNEGVITFGQCKEGAVHETYAQPQSAAGYASNGILTITRVTTTIPLKKGIGFGFSWKASNLPSSVPITYLVKHPEITKPDGTKMTSFTETTTLDSKNGVIETVDCYFLSEDHELVPGVWSISIISNGRELASKTFNVVSDRQP